ncbi:hypothetical protein ACFLWG_01575 [Chloroflexota bacterium]
MLLKMRKLREPFGKKSSAQEDDISERKGHVLSAIEAGDALVDQVESLKERVNERTRDLVEVDEQLGQLSNTVKETNQDSDEVLVKEILAGSIESESELSDQLGKEPPGKERDLGALLGGAGGQEQEKSTNDVEKGSFSDLFDDEEEQENLLVGLISSLPDVTAEELLNELQEIEAMIRER